MTYTLILRSIIIYILVLFLLRIMGKRQIGQMQPYEFVITLIIADLATVPMAETALPLAHGIIPLFTLVCIHFIFTFLEQKSDWARKVLNGKPVILVDPDGINYTNLKLCNMTFNDLQEGLRNQGYFNLEELLYVIIQTNGMMSVLPRAQYAPLTANAMKITVDNSSLPIIVASEGKINLENIKRANIDEIFIITQLKPYGFKSIKDILLMTINSDGKIYAQKYNSSFVSFDSGKKGDW